MRPLFRLLTFRLDAEGYRALGKPDAAFGLTLAWIAGIGRYWDHPTAGLAQKSGLGSVVYVLVLSALLWLTLRPFTQHRSRYWNVAAAVGLTAPPAWLYAIPVERWTSVGTAIELNVGFLTVVALWRISLYMRYLYVGCGFSFRASYVLMLLPVTVIVAALAGLNLEQAVFQLMGGLGREGKAERVVDATYAFVWTLAWLSSVAVVPLLIGYGALILRDRARRRNARGRTRRRAT